MSDDQKFHVLRASLPARGRALTLDEEVHPCSRLGNRGIQQAFLEILKTLLPLASHPVIVADSGFQMPFYRYVEHTLSWHWARCIRNRDFISWQNTTDSWFSATSLYSKANAKKEPWLLATSLSLYSFTVKPIMYQARMQIEEGFRDSKNHRHGLGNRIGEQRRANMLLMSALAAFLLVYRRCREKPIDR